MKIRVRKWEEFQHYKDRCPPWIKLHKSILDDYEFHCLPVASRALAPCLWLIASEDLQGVIDANFEKLAFRLRQTPKQIEDALKPLIDKGFFIKEQNASNALAERKQDAPLDREETETETEKKRAFALPDWIPEQAWNDWITSRKVKPTLKAKELAVRELQKLVDAGQDAKAVLEQSTMRGWTGLFPVKVETQKGATPAWWTSDALMETKARELGIATRGLTRDQLRGKINERMAA